MKPCTAFILPDQHYAPPTCKAGGVDPAAESCALQAIEIIKPDVFINLGDVIEANSISHWKYKRVKRPPLEYQLREFAEEVKAGNEGLDRFDAVLKKVGCKQKYLLWGNHDAWTNQLIEEHPYLQKEWNLETLFHTRKRGFKTVEFGKRLKIGKLHFYHGGLINREQPEREHALRWGVSVMYGHYHHIGMAKVGHVGGPHAAWSIGCICKLEKPFLQHRPTAWGHAFAVVRFKKSGDFHVEIIDVFRGECWVNGQHVKARL